MSRGNFFYNNLNEVGDPDIEDPELVEIREDLSFVEEHEAILDRQERVMRKKTIPIVKVLWKNNPERDATWKNEEMMRSDYPHFFLRFATYSFKIQL
ncbi:retrotransposon protein, putative, ty3-gypsy subclass [Tanacetum coccineum]